jgi:hypothetical protein
VPSIEAREEAMQRAACLVAIVSLAGVMVRGQAPRDPSASSRPEQSALAALDRYLETWNSRDGALWATSLHFPHVRPGPGAFELSRTPDEYAAGVDFQRTLATGWDHTEWLSRRVLQVGADKVHVAGTWQRYTADGRPLATSAITYIVTLDEGRWGVLSRFAAGAGRVAPDAQAGIERSATVAVRDFFDAWNSHDPERLAASLHFPQVRIADGAVHVWSTRDEFLAGPEPGRQRTWFETRPDRIEVAQVAPTGANVTVHYGRYGRDGTKFSEYDAVFLVIARGGAWRVQARSSMGP